MPATDSRGCSASDSFLTGVAFDDQDGDKRYDTGEGLGSFTINAKNNLTSGSGRDLFVFNTPFINAVDEITDFSPTDDFIILENAIFSGLQTGRLNNSAFHIGTEAHDSTDQIIYDDQTGALLFDTDAIGGADAQQFAQLTAGLSLQNSYFFII